MGRSKASIGGPNITSHDALTENGGAGSHVAIQTHMDDGSIHYPMSAINITASQVSDFDTEVGNQIDVAANTAARHAQNSDTSLDLGNANQVTALELRTHLNDATIHFTAASIGLTGLTNNSILRASGTNGIQDTTSNALLTDSGQLQISAFIVTGTGNAATPSHTFIGDQTSGDYRVAGNGFAASAAGSKIQHWKADGSIEFFGLLNHTAAGDQFLLSQDASPYREGSHSVLTSGDMYSLSNQRIMKYQSHNAPVDSSGNFLTRDEDPEHSQLITFLENGHIHYYHTTNTTGVPIWDLTWGINIANSTTGSGAHTYTILSQIPDSATAIALKVTSENTLATDGAKLVSFDNNGNELFYVGFDNSSNGVWANKMAIGAASEIDEKAFLKAKDTIVLDGATTVGVIYAGIDLDITMNYTSFIRTGAALSGRATIQGAGILPFASGLMFEVRQEGTSGWGAGTNWGQIPAAVTARYTSGAGSATLGSFVSNFLAASPTFDGGFPSDIYAGFAAAPMFAASSIIPRPTGLYVYAQNGTVEGIGIWIIKASHTGIKLHGDGIGSDIKFGADSDASILYDGANQVYNSQLVGSGYHDFIGGMKVTGNLGFYGTAPIGQAANTVAINDVLVNLGLRASGGFSNFSTTLNPRAGTAAAGTAPIKFTNGPLMTTPELGSIEFFNGSLYLTGHGTHRTVISHINGVKTSTTEVVNTTTETVLHSHTILANELHPGKVLKIVGLGRYSKGNGAHILTLRFKKGGVTLATFTSPSGAAANQIIDMNLDLTCRTDGVTGTVAIALQARLDGQVEYFTTTPTAVFDTTIDNTLSLTAQWDTADAGSSATLEQSYITWG